MARLHAPRQEGVNISGSIETVGGNIVGGDMIINGLDEEKAAAIFLEVLRKQNHGSDVLVTRSSPPPMRRATPSAPEFSARADRDVARQLQVALDAITGIISDLDDDRDVGLANDRLSDWKRTTDDIFNYSFASGKLPYEVRLYNIVPDAEQRTPFNKIKNEARKCQKIIRDVLSGARAVTRE